MPEEYKDALVLSVRQPWAWMVIHAGKDIENRSWVTNVRGQVLVHASKGMTRIEYENANDFFCAEIGCSLRRQLPNFEDLERGGIIGSIHIVDCVARSDSPWFQGPYGFVLRYPYPLPFFPCKGRLGFFKL